VERTSLLDRKIKEIKERERQRKQVYRQLVERTSLLDKKIKEYRGEGQAEETGTVYLQRVGGEDKLRRQKN
jgi:hypothetical protein